MRTIKIPVGVGNAGDIDLGRRGETGVTSVVFDVSQLIKTYGAGTAVLLARRPGDTSAYPVPAVQSGNTVTWTVSDTDTSNDGRGTAELFWYVGAALAKSVVFSTSVYKDIGVPVGETPDPYETWLDTLTELAAETQEAAASITGLTATAEALPAGSEPTANYADGVLSLGIPNGAQGATGPQGNPGATGQPGPAGQDGVSPTVSVTSITGGHRVAITDKDGTETFDVMDGADGAPGQNGQNGTNGTNGTDGVSPAVTITSIAGGHSVTITDKDHPSGQSFNVMDGLDGQTGQTGPAGPGVPSGGTAGQFLVKSSSIDYDAAWVTLAAWQGGNY